MKRVGKGNRVSLKVDGKEVSGDVVPFPPEGVTTVEVEVSLGE
ncbi:MAG: hypothetical protein ACUVQY_01225 [Thermoproteota archaeon]